MSGFNPIRHGSRMFVRGIVSETDGNAYIQPNVAEGISGIYGLAWDGVENRFALNRTPAPGTDEFVVSVPFVELRGTPNIGKKITSFSVVYSVDGADMDDVTVLCHRIVPPADGAAQTQVPVPFTYDANHDAPPKRGDSTGAPEYHTMVCTVDAGGVWMNQSESLLFKVTVNGDAGSAAAFKFFGIRIDYTKREGLYEPIGVETLQTTDATPTLLLSLPLEEGQFVSMDVWLQARLEVGPPRDFVVMRMMMWAYREPGGDATLSETIKFDYVEGTHDSHDPGEVAAPPYLLPEANIVDQRIDLNAVGVAGVTINWAASMSYLELPV